MTAVQIPPAVAVPVIQNRAERLAANMRSDRRIDSLIIADALDGIAADLSAVNAQMVPAQIDTANVRRIVAGRFINNYRGRRDLDGQQRPGVILSLWVAWENTRDVFARDVAEAVINGWNASLPEYAAAYAVARERMNVARRRYFDAYRAAKAEAGAIR
jgi:hypothetical protein